jgi:hypothetical protein
LTCVTTSARPLGRIGRGREAERDSGISRQELAEAGQRPRIAGRRGVVAGRVRVRGSRPCCIAAG